jgi:hypothetical protein
MMTIHVSGDNPERALLVFARIYLILGVIACCGIFCARKANALDVDADDYSVGGIPAGTNLGVLYAQYGNYNSGYFDGHKVSGGDLDTYIGVLRYARMVNIGPFTADPQFILPFGSEHSSHDLRVLGNRSGVGDLWLGSTVWFVHDTGTQHYFGLTGGVYFPVGGYDHNKPLNLGSNRWSYLVQTGYITPLITKKLILEVVADVTLYGNNNDYGISSQTLSQTALAEFQGWLRYCVTPNFDLRIGTAYYDGGETKVSGVSRHDRESTTTFRAGLSWSFAPRRNVVAYYTTDTQKRNGVKEAGGARFRLFTAF